MKNQTDLLSLHENKIDMCKKLEAIFTSAGRQLGKSISLIINVNLYLNTNDTDKILSSYIHYKTPGKIETLLDYEISS